MKALVGIFASNQEAVEAVKHLKDSGYPAKQLSLISKADVINNHIHIKSSDTAEKAELSIGVAAGAMVGILTGVGVFAIPGLGFLFGAGALVGAIAGIDFGIIGGGIVAAFTAMGIDEFNAKKYEKYLHDGKFLVFAQGDDKQIADAKTALHTKGLKFELDTV
ncbi:MAG TPA: hypothetical protein VG603_12480 [Chitinophagales bacterium]|nr:hypothetical protein [Chitinophagales bacterium]